MDIFVVFTNTNLPFFWNTIPSNSFATWCICWSNLLIVAIFFFRCCPQIFYLVICFVTLLFFVHFPVQAHIRDTPSGEALRRNINDLSCSAAAGGCLLLLLLLLLLLFCCGCCNSFFRVSAKIGSDFRRYFCHIWLRFGAGFWLALYCSTFARPGEPVAGARAYRRKQASLP